MFMKKLYLIALFSWIAFVSFGANGNSGKKLDHVFVYSGDEVTSKMIYIYDSDGSLKQLETLMPDNSGELANNGKEVYGYDEQGRMNDYESYVWHASSMTWRGNTKDGAKTHTTFDAEGRIDEVDYYKWDASTEAWGEHVYQHGVYTYDENWATEDREKWLNNTFSPADRRRYQYDSEGRVITLVRYNRVFSFETGDYKYNPTDSVTYSYDDHGNITEQSSYMYLDAWALGERMKYEYTYDEYDNIATETSYRWDDSIDDWMSGSTLTYENHYLADNDTYALPYHRDFSQDGLDGFDTEDGNADSQVWRIEDGALVCSSSVVSEAPDILYLPPLEMLSANEVRVAFNARLLNEGDSTQIQMILCSNDDELTTLGAIGNIHTIKSGEGARTYSELYYIGTPYPAPFTESFAGSMMSYQWMSDKLEGLDGGWGIGAQAYSPDTESQDGDGGLASFMATNVSLGTKTRLTSPKIDISNLTEPALGFYIYQTTGEKSGDNLVVEVSRNNGAFETVAGPLYVSGNETEGWVQMIIPLDAYKGEKALRLSFVGEAVDGTTNINIDHIMVHERAQVGVAEQLADKHVAYATGDGQIVVRTAPDREYAIDVYSVSGQKVYATRGNEAVVEVEPGIYVVDIEGARYKIAVR